MKTFIAFKVPASNHFSDEGDPHEERRFEPECQDDGDAEADDFDWREHEKIVALQRRDKREGDAFLCRQALDAATKKPESWLGIPLAQDPGDEDDNFPGRAQCFDNISKLQASVVWGHLKKWARAGARLTLAGVPNGSLEPSELAALALLVRWSHGRPPT